MLVLLAIVLVPLAYGGWHLKRWFNYEFGYGADVQQTVCQMVKPEYLKNPKDCE